MSIMERYKKNIFEYLERIHTEEEEAVQRAARLMSEHIKQDKIVYAYGPGGHSNMGPQEIFFRAGGLMHISAILDEGTSLSGGALRSTAMERTPGYAKVVLNDYELKEGDLLIIINAYGMNSVTIETALEAKQRGIQTIGVTSVQHALQTPIDHPARHTSGYNLHDLVDVVLDSKVPVGDAVVSLDGLDQKIAAISTFANAYLLNSLMSETIGLLVADGIEPPIWMSGNATGGDAANSRFVDHFKGRIKKL